MRRLLPLLALFLAACTPADLMRLFAPPALPPGSLTLVLAVDLNDPALSTEAVQQAADTVQRRLDLLGIPAETVINPDVQIVVTASLNDGTLGDRLPALLTRPGRVEFADLRNAPPALTSDPNDALLATSAHPTEGEHIDPVTGAPYETVLDAVQVIDAQATVSQFTGAWDVTLKFSPEHGALLSEYTAANIGTRLGILIDNRLLIAPVIQDPIGEEVLIAGNFTEDEARALAVVIGGGTLPVRLTLAEMR